MKKSSLSKSQCSGTAHCELNYNAFATSARLGFRQDAISQLSNFAPEWTPALDIVQHERIFVNAFQTIFCLLWKTTWMHAKENVAGTLLEQWCKWSRKNRRQFKWRINRGPIATRRKNLEQIIQVNLFWERLQDLTRYQTSAPSQWWRERRIRDMNR